MTGRQAIALLSMAIAGAVVGLLFVTVVGRGGAPGESASPTPVAAATRVPSSATERPRPQNTATPRPIYSPTPKPSPTPRPTPVPFPTLPPELMPPPDDPDNDGLTDAEEDAAGTDRYDWDTDYGGERDGAEVAAGRNPLDGRDDQPDPGCIPAGSQRFDVDSPDEPVRVPELEALIPTDVDGRTLQVGSMAGLPRSYGFFNYFWDGLLLCAGAQPDDLAHALGAVLLGSSDEGFGSGSLYAVFAIRVDGVAGTTLAEIHVGEAIRQGRGQVFAIPRTVGGREYTLLTTGGAVYATDEVMFWMVGMTVLDSGFYVDDLVDVGMVESTVTQLPGP